MRAGRFEQIGTPEHVFEEPATEYVAGFIGMSNRLPLVHEGAAWTFVGETVTGDIRLPGNPTSITARLRPEDLQLAPPGAQHAAGTVSIPAKVVDSQFGGRHIDVVVRVQENRLHARVPTGSFNGWARKLELDQDAVLTFEPSSAVFYGDDGNRIAGHVDLSTLATVGA